MQPFFQYFQLNLFSILRGDIISKLVNDTKRFSNCSFCWKNLWIVEYSLLTRKVGWRHNVL